MPIIIPREGPICIDPNAFTQEQRDNLWEQIVKNWVQKHPEELRSAINESKEDE